MKLTTIFLCSLLLYVGEKAANARTGIKPLNNLFRIELMLTGVEMHKD